MTIATFKPPMTLQRWYGTSLPVPLMGTWQFAQFAVSGLGLVRSLVHDKMGMEIRIQFVSGGTAYADWDHKAIAINQDYLKGLFQGIGDRVVDGDTSLTAILGIIVHEAAHFAYSPKDLTLAVDYVRERTTRPFSREIVHHIANVIEDIYIEAEVDREVPALTWMLETLNDLFFSTVSVQENVERAMLIESAPEDVCTLSHALNLLILAKVWPRIEATPFMLPLFELARSATEATSLKQRCELTLYIYDALMEKITQEQCEAAGQDGSDKEGAAALENSKKISKGYTSSPDGGKRPPSFGRADYVETIEAALEELVGMRFALLLDESEYSTADLVIEEVPRESKPVHPDNRYLALAELARQRATVNRPYGLDRNRGHNIRKLYRISTDSRIFAESVWMSNYKPMEVIILLDCSGSMRAPMEGDLSRNRILAASEATLGAAVALVSARCDVAVYGHTADLLSMDLRIYRCKEFSESIEVLAPRLGQVVNHASKAENRDGNAINYVVKKFSHRSRRRLLIVISDGAPLANSYSGHAANAHTKDAVDKARQQGIDVLSISISESAERTNDTIYGARHNVKNHDPNVIGKIVESLIS